MSNAVKTALTLTYKVGDGAAVGDLVFWVRAVHPRVVVQNERHGRRYLLSDQKWIEVGPAVDMMVGFHRTTREAQIRIRAPKDVPIDATY